MRYNTFIDSHNHIWDNFTLDEMELVLKKYNIDMCIISDLTGGNINKNNKMRTSLDTINANEGALSAYKNSKFIKCQFFFDSRYDKFTNELGEYLLKNRDIFVAIKIHNLISNSPANSELLYDILNFAEKNKFPVMFHTDSVNLCGVKEMQAVVDKYPDLILVLGHAFLNVDTKTVIEFMIKNNKVYADTSWAETEKVIGLLKSIPSERLMFGTDAPVDGELGRGEPLDKERCNFKWYNPLFEALKDIPDDDFNNFMRNTAVNVYKI